MNKITIARGLQLTWLYNDIVKPAIASVNASLTGVTLTCSATDSTSHASLSWVLEAEFENERDMTLFLLGDGAQEDLEKHLRNTPFDPDIVDVLLKVLLKVFSKYVIT